MTDIENLESGDVIRVNYPENKEAVDLKGFSSGPVKGIVHKKIYDYYGELVGFDYWPKGVKEYPLKFVDPHQFHLVEKLDEEIESTVPIGKQMKLI